MKTSVLFSRLKTSRAQIFLLSILLFSTFTLQAQTFPIVGSCNFDTYNGTNTNTLLVATAPSASFPLVPSSAFLSAFFGANASVSASGANEVEVGGINITNFTGGDISEVLIAMKGTGFWTQNIAGTVFNYYTWNSATQSWTGTLGDGRTATIKVLGASVNGVAVPVTNIQMMPAINPAAGYTLAEVPNTHSNSFTDAGTGITHSASGTLAVPNSIPYLKLGALANGATFTNVRVKLGLYFQGGGDAWVSYNADGSVSGDYDYFIQAESALLGTTYDYGDAPASYGVARHAPALCTPAIYIGANRPDYELSVTGSSSANADDNNTSGYADESIPLSNYDIVSSTYSISVPYVNRTGSAGSIAAWIDWNNNGSFDAAEMAGVVIGADGTATLTWKKSGAAAGEGTIPSDVPVASKIVRIRIGTFSLAGITPSGTAPDGEVEDMVLPVLSTLPVTLTRFQSALTSNCSVKIDWETSFETNFDHFELQKSYDGIHFASFVSIEGNGNNSSYVYYDADTKGAATIFYRLKTVDDDSSFSYSKVTSIKIKCNGSAVNVFPAVTNGILNIQGLVTASAIRIFDATGKLVQEKRTNNINETIDLSGTARGIYYIIVSTNGINASYKVVKQ